jgi:hypothetical protein
LERHAGVRIRSIVWQALNTLSMIQTANTREHLEHITVKLKDIAKWSTRWF